MTTPPTTQAKQPQPEGFCTKSTNPTRTKPQKPQKQKSNKPKPPNQQTIETFFSKKPPLAEPELTKPDEPGNTEPKTSDQNLNIKLPEKKTNFETINEPIPDKKPPETKKPTKKTTIDLKKFLAKKKEELASRKNMNIILKNLPTSQNPAYNGQTLENRGETPGLSGETARAGGSRSYQ